MKLLTSVIAGEESCSPTFLNRTAPNAQEAAQPRAARMPIVFESMISRSPGLPPRFGTANLLREVPLMSFRIFSAITAMAISRIRGLLEDHSAGFLRTLEMFVHVLHIDVQALCRLAEPLRVPIPGSGTPHHDHVIAKLHRGVID